MNTSRLHNGIVTDGASGVALFGDHLGTTRNALERTSRLTSSDVPEGKM
jgi:hypothetical protein